MVEAFGGRISAENIVGKGARFDITLPFTVAGHGVGKFYTQNALQAGPTYNLQAKGNVARIGSAIPEIFGVHRVYPDFGATPYTEY